MVDDRLDLVELLADLSLGEFHIVAVLSNSIQSCAEAPITLPRRSAVSAVIPARFRRDALNARAGKDTKALASAPADKLSGTRTPYPSICRGDPGASFLAIFRDLDLLAIEPQR